MSFEAFDVVSVPFPFSDRPVTKRRPALVLTGALFHSLHDHCVLAMITSARSEWPSDVVLRDLRAAGLTKPCKVRFKLFTLDAAMVVARRGRLAARDAEAVRGTLARFLTG